MTAARADSIPAPAQPRGGQLGRTAGDDGDRDRPGEQLGGARVGDDRARVVDLVVVDLRLFGDALGLGDKQRDRLPRRPPHREAVRLSLTRRS